MDGYSETLPLPTRNERAPGPAAPSASGEPGPAGSSPPEAIQAAETGLSRNNLILLALKLFYVRGIETGYDLADHSKLHIAIAKDLLEEAKSQGLVEILSAANANGYNDFRYGLTGKGREWAVDALQRSKYVGPAPVTLEAYSDQVRRQSVTKLSITREVIEAKLTELILSDDIKRGLGPAVNSGRSLLIYGAPGNGKSTIAEAISGAFGGLVHIPYALEIDGDIIKFFDPIYHRPLPAGDEAAAPARPPEFTDRRWVRCRRPVITVGGELTLEMLDLQYSPVSGFYEAPLHLKANGGIFIVDDLGRQLVNPKDLLNRWIVPMDKGIDFIGLQNGSTFSIPFDNLLIFSTNLEPGDLMDPAFLRRIPYKLEMTYPSEDQFKEVFRLVSKDFGLEPDDSVLTTVLKEIRETHGQPLCFYQPKFIAEQVIAACRYEAVPPVYREDMLKAAIANISAKTSASESRTLASGVGG